MHQTQKRRLLLLTIGISATLANVAAFDFAVRREYWLFAVVSLVFANYFGAQVGRMLVWIYQNKGL